MDFTKLYKPFMERFVNCLQSSPSDQLQSDFRTFFESSIGDISATTGDFTPQIVDFVQSLRFLPLFRPDSSEILRQLIVDLLHHSSPRLTSFVVVVTTKILEASPLNKFYIYSHPFVDFLVDEVLNRKDDKTRPFQQVYTSISDLFVHLSELGISSDQIARIYSSSLKSSSSLSLLARVFERDCLQYKSVILFDKQTLDFGALSTKGDFSLDGFTISCWLQLHSGFCNVDSQQIDTFNWLQIKSVDNEEQLNLNFEDSSLKLEIKDPSSSVFHVCKFGSFDFQLGRLYNVCVILHPLDRRSSSMVDLYVDGEFIQSESIQFAVYDSLSRISRSISGPFISRSSNIHVKLFGSSHTDNVIPEFVNLLLISDCQKESWVLLSYYLGPCYQGNYQDTNILSHLDPKSKIKMEIQLSENAEKPDAVLANPKFDLQTAFKNLLSLDYLTLNFHSMNLTVSEETLNARVSITQGKDLSLSPIIGPGLIFWNSTSTLSTMFAVGGFGLILRIISESSSSYDLNKALKMLFSLLDISPESLCEFESNSGYNILATLLKAKKSLIDMDTLMSVLKFVGYSQMSPDDSFIANGLAYKTLIVDFEIWQPQVVNGLVDKKTKDTFKFVLFQLSVFGDASKYRIYNMGKLMDLDIIRRIIQELKYKLVDKDLLPILKNSLEILVKQNRSKTVIRLISLYVIYALSHSKSVESGELEREYGIAMLDVIMSIVYDPTDGNSSKNLGHILRCINAKWILILMNDSDIRVVLKAFKLLLKILFLLGSRSREAFSRSGGLIMMRLCLSKDWKYANDIFIPLFLAMFGMTQLRDSKNNLDIRDFLLSLRQKVKSNEKARPMMPGLVFVLNGMMNSCINMISEEKKKLGNEFTTLNKLFLDGISFFQIYCETLDVVYNNIPSLGKLLKQDPIWTNELLLLSCQLRRLSSRIDCAQLSNVSESLQQFLNSVFLEELFGDDLTLSPGKITKGQRFVDFFSSKYRDTFLMSEFPSLVSHVKLFMEEDDTLMQNNNICKIMLKDLALFFEESKTILFPIQDIKLVFEFAGGFLMKLKEKDNSASKLKEFKVCSNSFAEYYVQLITKCTESEIKRPNSSLDFIKFCCSILMLFREILFDNLNGVLLNSVFACLFKNLLLSDSSIVSLVSNLIRMLILETNCFTKLQQVLSTKLSKDAIDYMKNYIHSNDVDMKSALYSNSDVKNFMNTSFNKSLAIYGKPELEQVSIFDKLDVLSRRADAELQGNVVKKWKLKSILKTIVETETKKFYKNAQDDKSDLKYFVDVYDKLINRIPVEHFPKKSVLDLTECRYRVHNKLLCKSVKNLPTRIMQYDELPQLLAGCEIDDDHSTSTSDSCSTTDLECQIDGAQYEFIHDQTYSSTFADDKYRKIVRSLFVNDKIVRIVNVTRIFGLEMTESVLVIGLTHLYMVENYFHTTEGEIVDITDVKAADRDAYIRMLFGTENCNSGHGLSHRIASWEMSKLASVSKRKFLLRDVALEVFFDDGSSVLVTLSNRGLRDSLFGDLQARITSEFKDKDLEEAMLLASRQKIINVGNENVKGIGSTIFRALINVGPPPSANAAFSKITRKWRRGELSNFYYLMLVNTIAGRTFNDLTQYPVFPFVLSDYESKTLNLNDPKSYRDLSKPMGAQSEKRAKQFKERYLASKEMAPDIPPSHYGTHYSSAMVVASYLIRLEPFVRSYLLLQGGKFDHADRLFYSIQKTWKSASEDNTSDVRELIPEFYYLPEFLVNSNGFEFGCLQTGEPVNDVTLPPWARNSPTIFVQKMREALESDYVSAHLPEWIDLVFGYKQRGEYAIQSLNVFHHLSYAGAIDLDRVEDVREKSVIISTIHNFGQTPLQIFYKPHPKKWESLPHIKFDANSFDKIPIRRLNTKVNDTSNKPCELMFHAQSRSWLVGSNEHLTNDDTTIERFPSYGILINGKLLFEQLTASEVSRLYFVASEKVLIVGFAAGYMIAYKLTTDSMDGVTNSQKSAVRHSEVASTAAANYKHLQLQPIEVLRAHTDRIKSISASYYNHVLISTSANGQVFLWNLSDYTKIRRIGSNNECLAAISDEDGYIATIDAFNHLKLFTINGGLINQIKLKFRATSLSFSDFNLPEDSQTSNVPWNNIALVCVGFANGKVSIYELVLEQEDGWSIKQVTEEKISGAVTSLELKLDLSINGNGNKVGRAHLYAVNDEGELFER